MQCHGISLEERSNEREGRGYKMILKTFLSIEQVLIDESVMH